MCGLTGFIVPNNHYNADELGRTIKKMTDRLHHRGPDDSGIWNDVKNGIALGHRRLSIVDLSAHGHQPMSSACGRYVIAFNGEIYNYKNLKQELDSLNNKYNWRGHSDTEVLLAAISLWGLEKSVKELNGMFAFALWDKKTQVLSLARDRIGEKPLYYGWQKNTFLFGSELKALKAFPDWQAEIDRNALALYMRHNYIPAPYSIYQNIYKLTAGSILSLPLANIHKKNEAFTIKPYWSAKDVVEENINTPFLGSDKQAIIELDFLLTDAVKLRMEADVPLGTFLSGGFDSSLVTALMQKQSKSPIKTFSIGFHEAAYNEAQHAKKIANHLGTEHTELYVSPQQAVDVIPDLPFLYDEPFADSSQIPTFLVAQLAKQHVTVSLSGDGGDELFCGYSRYFLAKDLWKKINIFPLKIRYFISTCIQSVPIQYWNYLFKTFSFLFKKFPINSTDKLLKLTEILVAQDPEELYKGFVSHWKQPSLVVKNGIEYPSALTNKQNWIETTDFTERMMHLDLISYLPDDILTKVDRATMGVGLESRIPLLDHRIVEFAWQLPHSMKNRNGQSKWLLRQVLYQYLPKEMMERPKMGFGVPINEWLKTSLRDWAEDLLDEKKLEEQGFFYPQPILEKWQEHLSGKRNWSYHLWDVLMFQAWLESQNKL